MKNILIILFAAVVFLTVGCSSNSRKQTNVVQSFQPEKRLTEQQLKTLTSEDVSNNPKFDGYTITSKDSQRLQQNSWNKKFNGIVNANRATSTYDSRQIAQSNSNSSTPVDTKKHDTEPIDHSHSHSHVTQTTTKPKKEESPFKFDANITNTTASVYKETPITQPDGSVVDEGTYSLSNTTIFGVTGSYTSKIWGVSASAEFSYFVDELLPEDETSNGIFGLRSGSARIHYNISESWQIGLLGNAEIPNLEAPFVNEKISFGLDNIYRTFRDHPEKANTRQLVSELKVATIFTNPWYVTDDVRKADAIASLTGSYSHNIFEGPLAKYTLLHETSINGEGTILKSVSELQLVWQAGSSWEFLTNASLDYDPIAQYSSRLLGGIAYKGDDGVTFKFEARRTQFLSALSGQIDQTTLAWSVASKDGSAFNVAWMVEKKILDINGFYQFTERFGAGGGTLINFGGDELIFTPNAQINYELVKGIKTGVRGQATLLGGEDLQEFGAFLDVNVNVPTLYNTVVDSVGSFFGNDKARQEDYAYLGNRRTF